MARNTDETLELRSTIQKLRSLADDLDNLLSGNVRIEPVVQITGWAVAQRAVPCLLGQMHNHPKVDKFGFTTELYFLDQRMGLARTLSRWYQLGQPLYPDNNLQ